MAQRAQVRDGKVRLSYATRPEVCGNGRNVHIVRSTDDWISDCQHGPALVALEWRAGTLVDVDTYVGGRWRAQPAGVVDLGTVRPADAVAFLLDLAGRVPGGVGHELIFPAIIADSIEVWPRLLALARNDAVPRETRKAAVFWLGQAVGERAVEGLTGLTADGGEDVDVQEHAVFALSQLHDGAGVPSLIEIARSHANPKVRKAAMFWLGQSNDPRALALFEEILRSR
jgi:hypothetical protein